MDSDLVTWHWNRSRNPRRRSKPGMVVWEVEAWVIAAGVRARKGGGGRGGCGGVGFTRGG